MGQATIKRTFELITNPLAADDIIPSCPVCSHRLVFLAMRAGSSIRKRQFWGCPDGHASVYRNGQAWELVEIHDTTVQPFLRRV